MHGSWRVLVLAVAAVAVLNLAPIPGHGALGLGATPSPVSPGEPGSTPPVPAPSAGVAAPGWTNLTGLAGATAPPAALGAALAYDVADSEWVMFGGCGSVCPSNFTWAFHHGGWTNLSVPGLTPPARRSAAMVFDSNAGGLLLFGGDGVSGTYLNDTWLFQGGRWTDVTAEGGSPAPRASASLIFDPGAGVNGSLLFGGCVAYFLSVVCYNDTWLWQPGAGWNQLQVGVAPPAEGFASLGYDAQEGYAVLYGGFGTCGSVYCFLNTTWEFHSGTWWAVSPLAAEPPARFSAGMAWDASLRGLVLLGGLNGTTSTDQTDTWLFSGGAWTRLPASVGPSPRSQAALAADGPGNALLLFGGTNDSSGATLGDTWAYELPLTAGLTVTPSAPETSQAAAGNVSLAGGDPPYDLVVTYGDGAGSSGSSAGPAFLFEHAYTTAGTVNVTAVATDAVGISVTAVRSVDVASGPSVAVSTTRAATDVGLPVGFSAVATGSNPVSSYAWSFGDGGMATTRTANHTFASSGAHQVTVTVTDSVGGTAIGQVSYWVNPAVNVTLLPPPSATAGSPVALLAEAAGGTAPYSYAWVLGDGGTASSVGPTHVFAAPGTYTVQVWVNDSAGTSAHAQVSLTVAAAPPAPGGTNAASSSAGIPTWYWGALGAIVAGTAVLGYLLLRTPSRKR